MKEIKFRAFQDGQMLTQPLSGIYGAKRFLGFLYEDTELMQFTGLQDKNGRDIYEGDIVAWIWLSERMTEVVKWDVNRARFYAGDRVENLLTKVEVIGNIHENPELLS